LNISYFRSNPIDALKIWDGGLFFSGGLILAILTMVFYCRTHNLTIWHVGDLWAPAVAFGQGIGWIGCFFVGCGYGKYTHLPWAIVFTHPESLAPLHIPLHPTQVYSSLSGFAIFLILLWIRLRRKYTGQVFLWMLILDSTYKLLIERFRADNRTIFVSSDMTVTQLIALIIMATSVISLWHLRSDSSKKND
jgi:phosphatidylglycerol:prolipoprotein diacylglycerol transferase